MAVEKAPKIKRLTLEEFDLLDSSEQRFAMLNATYDVHDLVVDIQNEAADMMSPDKMMSLASGFLGMG